MKCGSASPEMFKNTGLRTREGKLGMRGKVGLEEERKYRHERKESLNKGDVDNVLAVIEKVAMGS